jgi:transglutaminase-like putative cysteine protease
MGAELLDDDLARAVSLDPRHVDLAAAREVTYVLRNDVAYDYPAPIRALHHRLVILPRLRHGDQLRLAHRLAVDAPSPTAVRGHYDWFGNPVVDIEAAEIPRRISFALRAVLHRTRDQIDGRPWCTTPRSTTTLTAADDDLREVAATIDPRARGERLATSICHAVHDAMTYRHGETTVRTTAREAWQRRQGVCQDMAHVMIAMCRARGLPARYVSGHLVGEGGSHAWVEVHDDRSERTAALDPTHNRPTDLRYVTVAVGRDYRDVAPTAGHYRTGPHGTLSVNKAVAIANVR